MSDPIYPLERLLKLGKDMQREHKSTYTVCSNAFDSAITHLSNYLDRDKTTTTNNNKKYSLPDVPTPEMLCAVYSDGSYDVQRFSASDSHVREVALTKMIALRRYNRLKAIIDRPATKTVTMYIVSWSDVHTGILSYNAYFQGNAFPRAKAEEASRKEEGHKHVTVTEIQQTVDDTAN